MSFSAFQQALAKQANDLSGTQRGLGLGGIISLQVSTITGAIGSNLTLDTTIIVPGASLGDFVLATPTTALATGLELTSFVSAANTVTVRFGNATAGSITPGTLVFNILVLKP